MHPNIKEEKLLSKDLTAPYSNPSGKPEFTDGTNWFTLATENFVLNALQTISTDACIVATTANLTATYSNGTSGVNATLTNSGTQAVIAVDGVTLTVGQRVLVKDQTTQFQNGVYTITNVGSVSTNWVLTRATNFDSISQMVRGNTLEIISGTTNGVTLWMLTSIVSAVGTDSITFARVAKSGVDSVVGTTNQIAVSISNNIATISIASNPVISGTGSITIPSGTTAQRPSPVSSGMLRFNTSL